MNEPTPARASFFRVHPSLLAFFIPTLLSLAAAWLCHRATGPTLGLFFGPILLATFLVPPLVMAWADSPLDLTLAIAGVVVGVLPVWVGDPRATVGDVLACLLVLLSYAVALAGIALALSRVARVPAALASFVTMLLGLAWLTWPVWLSPWLAGKDTLVAWLGPVNPLLAVNSTLKHMGLWDERPLAYRLTALVRDVTYAPPKGVRQAVLLHLLVGGVLLGATAAITARRAKSAALRAGFSVRPDPPLPE
jgi:hypothetical protein